MGYPIFVDCELSEGYRNPENNRCRVGTCPYENSIINDLNSLDISFICGTNGKRSAKNLGEALDDLIKDINSLGVVRI